jgi:2-polyprenyl-3-methyl-5-hydroxy-6-metoxy-1,4-benzoquinol methylase
MREEFGRSYFYGFSRSNYLNYEKLNPSKLFSGIKYFVRKHNIRVSKVLDVGCASGFLLKELSSALKELHGLISQNSQLKKQKRQHQRRV